MNLQQFILKTYREFKHRYGNLEVYKDHDTPDRLRWFENKDYYFKAYVMDTHTMSLNYGYWTSPHCFVIHDKWSEAEIINMFNESRLDTSVIDEGLLKVYQERQWAYFSQVDFENFQRDTEIIYEGIIEIYQFYEDNTLKRRTLIDEQTGELLYEANYGRGVYEDPESGKQRSYLKYMDRYQNGKFVAAERKKINNRVRWVISSPRSYAGKTLEDIYFNAIRKYGKSTKRPNK